MNVLVIGSGGREHAICWKLAHSPRLSKLFCGPGNAGIANVAECVPADVSNIPALVDLAKNLKIDLTIVGPEQPLVAGIVDAFTNAGLRIIGPTAAAARLEGSKIFAKEFMARHNVPTGRYEICETSAAAREVVRSTKFSFPMVLKADGLAAGKGVVIAADLAEAEAAIAEIMDQRKLGSAGDRLLIEECLVGRESSYLLFSDGESISPMVTAQDYKRAFDQDAGPNTGGMGTFSIPGQLSSETEKLIIERIAKPSIEGAVSDGFPFQGILFIGLMLTADGPKVLEYNVRFGDPETQSILKRLETDLLEVFEAIADSKLNNVELKWSNDAAVCIVAASKGYPGAYGTGKSITGLQDAELVSNVTVFHAGTKLNDRNEIVTAGGRVLGVTARAETLSQARQAAYSAIEKVNFEGMFYRRDIANTSDEVTRAIS
jgi:phosphoribosylamine--glycine ligase